MREKQEPRLALPHSIAKRYRFSSFCLVERLNGLARGTRTTARQGPVRQRVRQSHVEPTHAGPRDRVRPADVRATPLLITPSPPPGTRSLRAPARPLGAAARCRSGAPPSRSRYASAARSEAIGRPCDSRTRVRQVRREPRPEDSYRAACPRPQTRPHPRCPQSRCRWLPVSPPNPGAPARPSVPPRSQPSA
jgi:hypothetical protein